MHYDSIMAAYGVWQGFHPGLGICYSNPIVIMHTAMYQKQVTFSSLLPLLLFAYRGLKTNLRLGYVATVSAVRLAWLVRSTLSVVI